MNRVDHDYFCSSSGDMNLGASITPAVRQDWPVIEKMFADMFHNDIYFPLMQRRLKLARQFSGISSAIAALFAGKVYVVRANKQMAGFLILKKTSAKQMHLHYLAVAPEFRRQGLGGKLVNFAGCVAQELGADIFLETEAGSSAMKLYSSLGFRVDSQFHIYRLVTQAVLPDRQKPAVALTQVKAAKGLLTLAKEWLLGYSSSIWTSVLSAGRPLYFHVTDSGSSRIIHCRLYDGSKGLLGKILPHLAFWLYDFAVVFLVLSGTEAELASTWLCDRIDYVTMMKTYQP